MKCECEEKINFGISFLGKKVGFSYGILQIYRITNFRICSFSCGQGVAQIKSNLEWSITKVMRVQGEKNFGKACLRIKLGFHAEFCEFSE